MKANPATMDQTTITAPDVDEFCEALGAGEEMPARFVADVLMSIGIRVFPIQEAGHHKIPGHQGAEEATTDTGMLDLWWPRGSRSTEYGLAVVPSSAGLVVVTVDDHAGIDAWWQLTGEDIASASAIVTLTPRGGTHYWFRASDNHPPASTHTEGLAIKTDDDYVIVHGGKNRESHRTYLHTRQLSVAEWMPIHVPAALARPASSYANQRSDANSRLRIAEISRTVTPTSEMLSRARQIAETEMRVNWEPRNGLSARCASALRIVRRISSLSGNGELHLGTALEEVRAAWQARCGEEDDGPVSHATALVWAHLRNLEFAAADYMASDAPRKIVAPVVVDLDWSEPFDDEGMVKNIPINVVAPDFESLGAALAHAWDVAPETITRAARAARDGLEESGGDEIVHLGHVHEQVFWTPAHWISGQSVNAAGLRSHVQRIGHFRVGVDGSLLRYNFSGKNRGLWTEDGKSHLTRLLEHCLRFRFSTHALNTILELVEARSDRINIPGHPETWPLSDTFYCANGVVNWREGSDPREPQPSDLLTVKFPFEWVPGATCPRVDKFFGEVFEADAVDTCLQVFGVAMHAEMRVKKAVILYGGTNTGKSTVLNLLTAFIGSTNISNMSLKQLGENTFAAAALFNKRVNICGDIAADAMRDPGLFKTLVGGSDSIQADRKYRDAFSFENHASLVFSANEMPQTIDRSDAYYGRILPLPCTKEVPPEKKNLNLINEIATPDELAGLAQKAVSALWRVLQDHDFTVPETSVAATRKYMRQTDHVVAWFEDCIEITGNDADWITKSDLRKSYTDYCIEFGYKPMADNKVSESVSKLERKPGGFRWSVQRAVGDRTSTTMHYATGVKMKPRPARLAQDDI